GRQQPVFRGVAAGAEGDPAPAADPFHPDGAARRLPAAGPGAGRRADSAAAESAGGGGGGGGGARALLFVTRIPIMNARGEEWAAMTYMARDSSRDGVLREIVKCEVRCADCPRERTVERRSARRRAPGSGCARSSTG